MITFFQSQRRKDGTDVIFNRPAGVSVNMPQTFAVQSEGNCPVGIVLGESGKVEMVDAVARSRKDARL